MKSVLYIESDTSSTRTARGTEVESKMLVIEVLSLILFVGCVGITAYCAATGNGLAAMAVGLWVVIIGFYLVLGHDER